MKRTLMAAAAAITLSAASVTAFAGSPTATIEIKAPITSNTCEFDSLTPKAYELAGSSIADLTVGDGPTQRVDIVLQNCAITGADIGTPAIHFNAQASQVSGMALTDLTGNTGAGFLLFQDVAGANPIDPLSGDTLPALAVSATPTVRLWAKLHKIGTLAVGTVDAKADVSIVYP